MDWLQLHLVAPAGPRRGAGGRAARARRAVGHAGRARRRSRCSSPASGEMPLWPEVAVSALFDAATRRVTRRRSTGARARRHCRADARWEVLEDRPWEREWLQHFAPLRCGERLWVCPQRHRTATGPGRGDPAPRSRASPSAPARTRPPRCAWSGWTRTRRAGLRVIDYGCGSGILGIAALLLGAARVQRGRHRSAGAAARPARTPSATASRPLASSVSAARGARRRRSRPTCCWPISSPARCASSPPRFAALVRPAGTRCSPACSAARRPMPCARPGCPGSRTSALRSARTGGASTCCAGTARRHERDPDHPLPACADRVPRPAEQLARGRRPGALRRLQPTSSTPTPAGAAEPA